MSGENTVSSDEKALDVAWVGRYECGCVVAASIGGPDDFVFTEDPEIVAVEETTVSASRELLTSVHSRPSCVVAAERDRARSTAVSLEQELARRDRALDEIRALHVAEDCLCDESVTQRHLTCDFDGESWPCETARILSDLAAALDAHLNKEDDGED